MEHAIIPYKTDHFCPWNKIANENCHLIDYKIFLTLQHSSWFEKYFLVSWKNFNLKLNFATHQITHDAFIKNLSHFYKIPCTSFMHLELFWRYYRNIVAANFIKMLIDLLLNDFTMLVWGKQRRIMIRSFWNLIRWDISLSHL